MDSKVFLPITTTLPVVICLNHLKSSGRCHGILFPAPMTRFSDMAAMALNECTGSRACRVKATASTSLPCKFGMGCLIKIDKPAREGYADHACLALPDF